VIHATMADGEGWRRRAEGRGDGCGERGLVGYFRRLDRSLSAPARKEEHALLTPAYDQR
jgi:hypothetical protein